MQTAAYVKGYGAFFKGKGLHSNPYDHGTQEYTDWRNGFWAAQEIYVSDDPEMKRYA